MEEGMQQGMFRAEGKCRTCPGKPTQWEEISLNRGQLLESVVDEQGSNATAADATIAPHACTRQRHMHMHMHIMSEFANGLPSSY
eukprot:6175856-Pleurochrysis_carterae.AAC.1